MMVQFLFASFCLVFSLWLTFSKIAKKILHDSLTPKFAFTKRTPGCSAATVRHTNNQKIQRIQSHLHGFYIQIKHFHSIKKSLDIMTEDNKKA